MTPASRARREAEAFWADYHRSWRQTALVVGVLMGIALALTALQVIQP